MKKLACLFIFALASFALKAQTVNNVPLKDIDVEYIEIIGISKLLSTKLNIFLDFGQRTKFFAGDKDIVLKDADGKRIDFNSMIDALNFMSKNGYEFVTTYVVTENNISTYHYLLRNKKYKSKDKD